MPSWAGIQTPPQYRLAYEYAAKHMKEHGLCDGRTPPVWTFETQEDDLELLAASLLSEHEFNQFEYVTLELFVPENRLLRSSYGHWCELLFQSIETGRIEDDGSWLCLNGQQDDHSPGSVQILIPHIRKEWIRKVEPLEINPDMY